MPNEAQKATSTELRQFLAQMRGKSPKEMLGAVASSNLFQSTITAAASITAAIVVLTLIPFGFNKLSGNSDTAAATIPAESQPANASLETPQEPSLNPNATPDAANQLGIGDAKDAPTNVNPLESSTGDLLEGLE